jgi:Tol biopolymer transport system component
MSPLAAILAFLVAQDDLDAILQRLSSDEFEIRESAQRQLHEYLKDDGKVERLREAAKGLEIDAQQRVKAVLEAHARRKEGWIAFIRRGEETRTLWIVRPDGTDARALTQGIDVDFNQVPMWSPDAAKLVFVADAQVYGVDVEGKNLRKLTAGEARNSAPLWSPDGASVVFSSYFFDGKSNRGSSTWKAVNPDGTGLRDLPHDAWAWRRGGRDFSPDGSRRCDAWAGRIRVSDPDGHNPRPITAAQGNGVPVWSPDGQWIAYSSTRRDLPRIYVTDPDGKAERLITAGEGYFYGATWSPDSRRLCFVSTKPDFEGICVIDLDGKNLKILTDRVCFAPSWSPSTPFKR